MKTDSYLDKRCIELRDRPEEKRERCKPSCYYLLVYIGSDFVEWRCLRCLNYLTVKPVKSGQQLLF